MPIPEVEVATVETRDVPMYGEWVATLDGYVNAEIRPQVAGYIIKQNYTEGSLVRKGQVLFEIDPRPFQATLDRAKGDLSQAQAQLGKSTLDVERDTPLAEARAIAKSQLDNEVQAKLGAQAAVESAKAAVEQAELNLEWTKVTSLVDGIAGIAQVQIGNLVGSSSILTSVSQVDPIKTFFPITEHEYLIAQSKTKATSSKHTISFFGNSLQLILTDGSIYPQKGKILLADRQWIPARARFASLLPFLIPETFCVPASTDVCASRPAPKRRFAATAKRRSESAGKLSGGSCRQRSQSEYAHRKTRCNGRDDVGD